MAAEEGYTGPVELSKKELVSIGAAAQGFAGFCTNPMDALKTQVQADRDSHHPTPHHSISDHHEQHQPLNTKNQAPQHTTAHPPHHTPPHTIT